MSSPLIDSTPMKLKKYPGWIKCQSRGRGDGLKGPGIDLPCRNCPGDVLEASAGATSSPITQGIATSFLRLQPCFPRLPPHQAQRLRQLWWMLTAPV